jgi:hypothetical protein
VGGFALLFVAGEIEVVVVALDAVWPKGTVTGGDSVALEAARRTD